MERKNVRDSEKIALNSRSSVASVGCFCRTTYDPNMLIPLQTSVCFENSVRDVIFLGGVSVLRVRTPPPVSPPPPGPENPLCWRNTKGQFFYSPLRDKGPWMRREGTYIWEVVVLGYSRACMKSQNIIVYFCSQGANLCKHPSKRALKDHRQKGKGEQRVLAFRTPHRVRNTPL